MNNPIPDPDAVFLQLLVWLGLPAILVAIVAIFLSLTAWWNFATKVGSFSVKAYADLSAALRQSLSANLRHLVLVSGLGAVFIAWTYANVQFVQFFAQSRVRSTGVLNMLKQTISYSGSTPLSTAALVIILATVVAAMLSAATTDPRYLAPTLIWVPLGWLCVALGIILCFGTIGFLVFGAMSPESEAGQELMDLGWGSLTWAFLLLVWYGLSRGLRRLAKPS